MRCCLRSCHWVQDSGLPNEPVASRGILTHGILLWQSNCSCRWSLSRTAFRAASAKEGRAHPFHRPYAHSRHRVEERGLSGKRSDVRAARLERRQRCAVRAFQVQLVPGWAAAGRLRAVVALQVRRVQHLLRN